MKKDEVWRTKNGQAIEVKDMSEEHVRNALRSILRHQRIARRSQHNQDSLIHFKEHPNPVGKQHGKINQTSFDSHWSQKQPKNHCSFLGL